MRLGTADRDGVAGLRRNAWPKGNRLGKSGRWAGTEVLLTAADGGRAAARTVSGSLMMLMHRRKSREDAWYGTWVPSAGRLSHFLALPQYLVYS